MQVLSYKLRPLIPPKDDLFQAIRASRLSLKDGDILVIASKVVSIDEGRCIPVKDANKQNLIRAEADMYFKPLRSRYRRLFTLARGMLVGSAGIDESNGNGHYVLYPKDPFHSAKSLRRHFMKAYGVKRLGLVITDSTSLPLRRGAVGFALAWDGFDPLRDYRGTPDLFGRSFEIEMANLADALAATAVLEMGEGTEKTPIVVLRGTKNIVFKNRSHAKDQLVVPPEDDLFAPLLFAGRKWRRR
jgi:coenzyme F420-0:L-glutamate ligase